MFNEETALNMLSPYAEAILKTEKGSDFYKFFMTLYKSIYNGTLSSATNGAEGFVSKYIVTEQFKKLASQARHSYILSANLAESFAPHKSKPMEDIDELNRNFDIDDESFSSSPMTILNNLCERDEEKTLEKFEDAENLVLVLGGFSRFGAAETNEKDPQVMEAFSIIRNNERIRKIVQIAGNLISKSIRLKRATPTERAPYSENIKLGSEIAEIIPNEFAPLVMGDENYQNLFFANLINSEVRIYDYKGKTRQGDGPIGIFLDNSSSTDNVNVFEYICGCAYAIKFLADSGSRNRDVYLYIFNSSYRKYNITNYSPLELLTLFKKNAPTGGTNLEGLFEDYIESISSLDHKEQKADLIVITDGILSLSPEVMYNIHEAKLRCNFHIYSTLIGHGYNVDDGNSLVRVSDEVVKIPFLPSQNDLDSHSQQIAQIGNRA